MERIGGGLFDVVSFASAVNFILPELVGQQLVADPIPVPGAASLLVVGALALTRRRP
jgi:MYXO-CTERM domain-containing protein